MPLAVTFSKIVMQGANVWIKGDSLEVEVLYHLETTDGSERLARKPERTSVGSPGSFLGMPFNLAALLENPTIGDAILLLRDQIQVALAAKERV